MERKIVGIIILVTLLCNALPFLVGITRTPANSTYLGTVHYPIDYFFYLSNITQGKDRFLTTQYLYTTEPMPALFLGWLYVPFGRMGSILHITPIMMYQIMLAIFGFLYLIFAYWLISILLGKSSYTRIIAFLLFIFSNTLPRIIQENGHVAIYPYYSWYNFGEPFMRLDSVPHQLFINASIFMILVAFFSFPKAKNILSKFLFLFLAASAGMVLGSTQPVQWLLLSVCLFPVALVQAYQTRTMIGITIKKALPYLLFSGIGLFFALYVNALVSNGLFKTLSAWEASQSPYISFRQFIDYHGPVFIIGILSLPWFLQQKNSSRRILAGIVFTSLCIFFFPLSKKLPFLTFRYLSALPVLLYAASATAGIEILASRMKRFKPMVLAMILTLFAFMLVPLFIRNLQEKVFVDTTNVNFYMSNEAYEIFLKAGQISTPNDTFLVFWPFEAMFPAIAGRRVYFSNKFATIDFDKKSGLAYKFISNSMTPTEMKTFLHDNHITYVISYLKDFNNQTTVLTPVYRNATMAIQKVL